MRLIIRSIYYLPMTPDLKIKPDQVRLGDHVNINTLMFHFQDNIGGLEIQNPHGDFVPVDPVPGGVLVIVGLMLQRWTSDRLKATVHRMLVPTDERRFKARQAFLFFLHPDDDFVAKCLDGTDTYEPINIIDYFDYRVRAIYWQK